MSPLLLATRYRYIAIAKELLKAGADWHQTSNVRPISQTLQGTADHTTARPENQPLVLRCGSKMRAWWSCTETRIWRSIKLPLT